MSLPVPSAESASTNDQHNSVTTIGAGQLSNDETVGYIAEKVNEHQCILFLGSAIHAPSPDLAKYDYPKQKSPPFGGELANHLAEKGEYAGKDRWNLQRVAQHFESKKTRYRLVEEIRNSVHEDREPSPILRMLVDMEFPIVITTNYDHLYEQALELKAAEETASAGQGEKRYEVSIYNPNIKARYKTDDCPISPNPKRPFILKIHGDVSKPESIVVTEEDYIQFVLRMSDKHPYHPFGKNVLTHLIKWPTLFIGYSLTDYNLRLLFKTLRWGLDSANIPPNYAVDIKPDDLIRDVYESRERYVSFIVTDIWDFVPRLHDAIRKENAP
jgi:hypothetical protein